jgi:hypothetical protein
MGRREELGARIREAVDHHSQGGSYSEMCQTFFGLDVAAHERVEPYSNAVVQGWMYGSILPSLPTLRAIATTAGFDATQVGLRWLVYGSDYQDFALEETDFERFYRRDVNREVRSA